MSAGPRVPSTDVTTAVVAVWLPELLWQAECVGRPALQGRPLVVGGPAARDGVVAAASPAARQRGVRVGQRVDAVARSCDGVVVLPGHLDRAIDVAAVVHTRLESLLGPVAWLTVGRAIAPVDQTHGSRLHQALDTIRDEAASTLGVSVACGIAPTWVGADVAARLMAPAGLLHVVPRSLRRMLAPLSVKWLPGVDDELEGRLASGGVLTCGDLAALDPETLQRLVGRPGGVLARLASGADDRRVPMAGPLTRITEVITDRCPPEAAVASLLDRAVREGREVAEARVRVCAGEAGAADRVERVAARPHASLAHLERTLLAAVPGRASGCRPTFVTLLLRPTPAPGPVTRAVIARRRTA